MDDKPITGSMETGSTTLEELLEKTAFKDSLRLFLKNIDPEAAPQLVRTLMGKDVEVPLALAGTLPVLANCLIKALHELIVQIRDKFPPPLLAGFVESLLAEIDKETLARLISQGRELSHDLAPAFDAAWKAVQDRTARAGEDS